MSRERPIYSVLADILNCLNRFEEIATPPKKWTSVEIVSVHTQKGWVWLWHLCQNEFSRRWVQDADYENIDESYNGPELRVKQLKAIMEEYQVV